MLIKNCRLFLKKLLSQRLFLANRKIEFRLLGSYVCLLFKPIIWTNVIMIAYIISLCSLQTFRWASQRFFCFRNYHQNNRPTMVQSSDFFEAITYISCTSHFYCFILMTFPLVIDVEIVLCKFIFTLNNK